MIGPTLFGLLVAAAVVLARPPRRLLVRDSRRPVAQGSVAQGSVVEGSVVPAAVLADLLAALLTAGLAPDAAARLVRSHMRQWQLIEPPGMSAVWRSVDLAQRTGLAPAALVRSAGAEQRRLRYAEQVRAARRLGVMVVLPVGLCLLPAFVLITVVPMVVGLLHVVD